MGRKVALFRAQYCVSSQDCPKNPVISRSSLPSCEEKQQYSSQEDHFPIRCSHWSGPESIALLPPPPLSGRLFSSLNVISI